MIKRFGLAVLAMVVFCGASFGWNEKGHSVVSRLAWRRLTEQQRSQVTAILKKHPHYDEYLAANRPAGFTEDEWVFMRAACWADWVRSHHAAEFNHGPWHYINYPYVPPGSKVDPAKHQPPAGRENVVSVLGRCMEKIRAGTDLEKAIYMTWLFHLVGDIHQPLHCVAMFSEDYPNGDQGGNLVSVRLTGRPNKLHALWDGLLGNGTTAAAINRDVELIEAAMKEKVDAIGPELEAHKTPESWALEGAEIAKNQVYLNGELKLARSAGRNTNGDDAPQAPADYGANAGRLARMQVGKAGVRLASLLTRLFP